MEGGGALGLVVGQGHQWNELGYTEKGQWLGKKLSLPMGRVKGQGEEPLTQRYHSCKTEECWGLGKSDRT